MLVGLMQSVARDILLAQIVLLDGMVAFKVLQTIGQEVVALAEYARIIKSPEIGAFERQWMQNLFRIGVVSG